MTGPKHLYQPTNLRQSVYRNYGHDFQDVRDVFDVSTAKRWGKAYEWYLRQWLPSEKGARIVELACGYGRLLHFLKERGYTNLTGVDISPDQVSVARQVVQAVDEGDALAWISRYREHFDCIIALDLIEHFQRDEAVEFLNSCFNALNSGGRLIIQTPNADSPFGLQHRYNDITHEWAFNVNQLGRMLRRCAFTCIEPRELGPVPWGYSVVSTCRALLWKVIRAGLQFWNLVETGSTLPILTRVFLISAVRK